MHIDRIRALFNEYVECRNQMAYARSRRESSFGIGVHTDMEARIFQMFQARARLIDEQLAGPGIVSAIALEMHHGEIVWYDQTNRSWSEWRALWRRNLAVARNALRRMGYFSPESEYQHEDF